MGHLCVATPLHSLGDSYVFKGNRCAIVSQLDLRTSKGNYCYYRGQETVIWRERLQN
jgi:hypothetical protein